MDTKSKITANGSSEQDQPQTRPPKFFPSFFEALLPQSLRRYSDPIGGMLGICLSLAVLKMLPIWLESLPPEFASSGIVALAKPFFFIFMVVCVGVIVLTWPGKRSGS